MKADLGFFNQLFEMDSQTIRVVLIYMIQREELRETYMALISQVNPADLESWCIFHEESLQVLNEIRVMNILKWKLKGVEAFIQVCSITEADPETLQKWMQYVCESQRRIVTLEEYIRIVKERPYIHEYVRYAVAILDSLKDRVK